MKKAIIIGASSGIGLELAKLLVLNNYQVGITGRRKEALQKLESSAPDNYEVSVFDASEINNSEELTQLTDRLGGLDLLVISAGTGELNEKLDHALEQPTIALNVDAFTQISDWAYNYFKAQDSGHLVAITSIAGLRGGRHAPAYNASKAYQINYLEGLSQKANFDKLDLTITDIRPGFVDTDMAKGEGQFWIAPPEKAARQIMHLINKKKRVGYVTKRWATLVWLLKLMPRSIYKRF